MFQGDHELMTCSSCHEPAILTVSATGEPGASDDAHGLCPRCFYRQECHAICAAAEEEVDRVLRDAGEAPSAPETPMAQPPRLYVPPPAEPAWSW